MVEESTSPTPVASEEPTAEPTEEPAEETAAPSSYDGPTGIVAQYTNSEKTAATIFWNAPASTDGITGYAVQIQRNGGAREDLSSTPSNQFTLDITKSESSGWTTFIVQTVYADGEVADGKVFGLPGQWN
jgi:septal ring-binding cell division protein DamX